MKDLLFSLFRDEVSDDAAEWRGILENEIASKTNSLKIDESELCGICFTCSLGEEPTVQLGCGHTFHANCVL